VQACSQRGEARQDYGRQATGEELYSSSLAVPRPRGGGLLREQEAGKVVATL